MRDDSDTRGPAAFGIEEVGLLGSVAAGQRVTADSAYFRGPCVHADSMLAVSRERHLVSCHMGRTLQEECLMDLLKRNRILYD